MNLFAGDTTNNQKARSDSFGPPDPPPSGALNGKTPQYAGFCFCGPPQAVRRAESEEWVSCLIDGEVVCCDEKGLTSFQLLRHRRNESQGVPVRL